MQTYHAFVDAFHRHRTRDPNARVLLGIDERLGELPDPSLARLQGDVAEARELLAQLDKLDRATLSFDEALDLDLARLMLEQEIHLRTLCFNGRTTAQQQPSAGHDIGGGIFPMFVNDPRPAGDRLADITARIEKVPDFLEAMLGRLEVPVARWVQIDLGQVEGLPTLFSTVESWAREENWSDLERLAKARARAEEALARYSERLRALPTTKNIHLDDATARKIVALRGIDLPLEELHSIARRFLHETANLIEELRKRLVQKYKLDADTPVEALHEFLNRHFRVKVEGGDLSQVLNRYQEERARILRFIQERDLFPVLEEQDIKILQTPTFLAPTIPAGAMLPPPAFREGVRTSLVYLTLSPELLDEHTELGIPLMMIHEGIPGHHLQLATASTHPSVIRRHMEAMDQAEGWTTMLEDYMLDQGYVGELTDETRFCGKRDISRIGARVAIDLYFMTGERGYLDVGIDCDLSDPDPFVAAGSLLRAVTGFVPERVQAELNWYSQERGYPLSYLTGNYLVWQLKRDVEAKRGGSGIEIDREFHAAYLSSGNMPVSFLRRAFQQRGLLAG